MAVIMSHRRWNATRYDAKQRFTSRERMRFIGMLSLWFDINFLHRRHLRYDGAAFDVPPTVIKPVRGRAGHTVVEGDVKVVASQEGDEVAFRSCTTSLKSFRFISILPDVDAVKRVFLVEDRMSGVQALITQ